MTRAVKIAFVAPIATLLSGCEPPSPAAYMAPPPARDVLQTPAEITPGRLQYAREPDTFAPVFTDHFEVIKPRPRNPEKLNLGAIRLF